MKRNTKQNVAAGGIGTVLDAVGLSQFIGGVELIYLARAAATYFVGKGKRHARGSVRLERITVRLLSFEALRLCLEFSAHAWLWRVFMPPNRL